MMKEKEIFEQFLQLSNVKKEDVTDYRFCTELYAGVYIPNSIIIQLNEKYKNKEIIYTAFDIDTVVNELSKTTEKIINKVIEERKRQDKKWGEQNHSAPVWGMIIGEEYGEMCKAINEFGFNHTKENEEQIYIEAIHTMASCMAMIECIERARSDY